VLLLYTDGITEAESPEGEFFGEERLISLFAANHRLAPQQIIDDLLQQARLFTGTQQFNDDVSLVVLQVAEEESAVEK
jgi:phosphoserine phosphatase RsbU/P